MTSLVRCQRLLVGHGALVLLLGFVIGFGFVFFLIGEIALWPIPGRIAYQMPGTYDAWRMAHMEGIVNGFGLWIVALVLPLVPLSDTLQVRITWGMIVAAWTIVVASAIDPLFPDARGLSFGKNVPNTIAFLLFYVGILAVIWVVVVIAAKSLVAARADGARD
jgi:hypothetical protein